MVQKVCILVSRVLLLECGVFIFVGFDRGFHLLFLLKIAVLLPLMYLNDSYGGVVGIFRFLCLCGILPPRKCKKITVRGLFFFFSFFFEKEGLFFFISLNSSFPLLLFGHGFLYILFYSNADVVNFVILMPSFLLFISHIIFEFAK